MSCSVRGFAGRVLVLDVPCYGVWGLLGFAFCSVVRRCPLVVWLYTIVRSADISGVVTTRCELRLCCYDHPVGGYVLLGRGVIGRLLWFCPLGCGGFALPGLVSAWRPPFFVVWLRFDCYSAVWCSGFLVVIGLLRRFCVAVACSRVPVVWVLSVVCARVPCLCPCPVLGPVRCDMVLVCLGMGLGRGPGPMPGPRSLSMSKCQGLVPRAKCHGQFVCVFELALTLVSGVSVSLVLVVRWNVRWSVFECCKWQVVRRSEVTVIMDRYRD